MASAAVPAGKRVVVCGGGVIGSCTAYFLAQKGAAHVTVVEKSSIACAASGKAGGFLALDWCDGSPVAPLARASFNLHRTLADLLDGPRSYGYRPLHTLSLSVLPGGGGGAASAAALPPWVDGPTVGPPRTTGTVETTAQVHPPALHPHSARRCRGGAQCGGDDWGGGAGRGEWRPCYWGGAPRRPAVVLALGPWSSRNPLVSALCSISGLKAHSIVLRPRDPAAITPHALSLSYQPSPGATVLDPEVYPRPTGEVYICGMSSEAEVPDDPEKIVGDRASIRMLHKIAGDVSSHLRDGEAEVKAEQACFLPCSEDGLPVIGEIPGVSGCYVATGHSCWGILNGPATGASLAELILLGGSTTVDLKPFSPSRFLKKHSRVA